jgi:molecular chaperone HtpG
MLKNDREQYISFFKTFGRQLKYGIYSSYGMERDDIQDLLMFYSSQEKAMVTLGEYVGRMKEDQKFIYYASGNNIERIDKLPQTELVKDKGFEILYFADDIDEFAIQMLRNYMDKEFKSVSAGDLGLEKDNDTIGSENRELFDYMKELLKDKVSDVRESKRLKNYPVCLVSEGAVSIEMEKVLSSMPDNPDIKANKVLEINISHDIYNALKDAYSSDKEKLKMYTGLLYNQALLIEGLPVEDTVEFTNSICTLMK